MPSAFQWSMAAWGVQHVDATNHLVPSAEAQLGHQLAGFFGDQENVIDHVLRFAGELLPQVGILRSDADRAGIQVALPHHDAGPLLSAEP